MLTNTCSQWRQSGLKSGGRGSGEKISRDIF